MGFSFNGSRKETWLGFLNFDSGEYWIVFGGGIWHKPKFYPFLRILSSLVLRMPVVEQSANER